MRTKTVQRFYCDHCRRKTLQRRAMERHEQICFLNPRRGCCVCQCKDARTGEMVRVLINDGMDGLRLHTDNCPACIAAAIAQYRQACPADEEGPSPADFHGGNFDYKKELADWRKNQNDEARAHTNCDLSVSFAEFNRQMQRLAAARPPHGQPAV